MANKQAKFYYIPSLRFVGIMKWNILCLMVGEMRTEWGFPNRAVSALALKLNILSGT